jgi:hypothetical protein
MYVTMLCMQHPYAWIHPYATYVLSLTWMISVPIVNGLEQSFLCYRNDVFSVGPVELKLFVYEHVFWWSISCCRVSSKAIHLLGGLFACGWQQCRICSYVAVFPARLHPANEATANSSSWLCRRRYTSRLRTKCIRAFCDFFLLGSSQMSSSSPGQLPPRVGVRVRK